MWAGAGIVVIALVGFVVGPWVYGTFIAEDDAPAASVSTSGAEAASGTLDGEWAVAAGVEPNLTAAGYTVHEILRGADVTVVRSTGQVAGSATIVDGTLVAAEVIVVVDGIATDSGQRDNQLGGGVVDTATYPTAKFTLGDPVDLRSVPDDGTSGTVPATGTLTLLGEERPVAVDIEVLRTGDRLVASGSIPTTWSDYGVKPPSPVFVTVADAGSVDFLVTFEQN